MRRVSLEDMPEFPVGAGTQAGLTVLAGRCRTRTTLFLDGAGWPATSWWVRTGVLRCNACSVREAETYVLGLTGASAFGLDPLELRPDLDPDAWRQHWLKGANEDLERHPGGLFVLETAWQQMEGPGRSTVSVRTVQWRPFDPAYPFISKAAEAESLRRTLGEAPSRVKRRF